MSCFAAKGLPVDMRTCYPQISPNTAANRYHVIGGRRIRMNKKILPGFHADLSPFLLMMLPVVQDRLVKRSFGKNEN
jgi:hypothetical protein